MKRATCIAFLTSLIPMDCIADDNGLFPQSTIIQDCFYKGARYYSPFSLKFRKNNVYECQKQCVLNATWGCEYFGFNPFTGSCYLAGSDAHFTTYLGEGLYTGPRVCSKLPAGCSEVPSTDFPAQDELASKLAWPSHKVPAKLECWPKNYSSGSYASCPVVTVLEDTAAGWPGKCLGLSKVIVPNSETCKSICEKSPSCSVWQVATNDNYVDECWISSFSAGEFCYTRAGANKDANPFFNPKAAQRIMHGEVRVLKKLAFVQIIGLVQTFDQNYFIKQEEAVEACKKACYSDLGCQWWTYSKAFGCFVENAKESKLPVPLTFANYRNDTNFAQSVVAGEYIQHYCPLWGGLSSPDVVPTFAPSAVTADQDFTAATTSKPVSHSEANDEFTGASTNWLMVAVPIVLLLACVGTLFFVFRKSDKELRSVVSKRKKYKQFEGESGDAPLFGSEDSSRNVRATPPGISSSPTYFQGSGGLSQQQSGRNPAVAWQPHV